MTPYYITSLLTVVTASVLGLFVYYKNPENRLHRSLLRLNIIVAVWSLFLFLHYISKTHNQGMLTLYALHTAAIFIPACYLHLVIDLLGINSKKIIGISYCACIVFLPLIYSNHFISGISPKIFFKFYADAGRSYILWLIVYCAITLSGVILLITRYRESSYIKKIQIRYVLIASFIAFAGAATIYPLFYDIPMPPWGENIIFLYPIIFSVAVLKHDALELNIAIKTTIVYSISIALITSVFLIIVLLSERFLRGIFGYQSLGITVFAAVSIALVFTPLKNQVDSLIEKCFMRSAYQRLQKELIESDKSKALAQLAAGLAHEIRNPLTAIKTFCEYLPKKYDDKKFMEDFSVIVEHETDKINSLIMSLLEFAKPSALKIALCDMRQAVDYTMNLLSAEALKYKINITKQHKNNNCLIMADSAKLKHVLFNILKNSIEASSENGNIEITTSRDGNRFYVEIKDSGCGIKEKDLNRVFEPFFSSKDKGTGLGLSVARSIIAEHNGTILAKSASGYGSTFTISLPAS